jgi:hypothetical protein
MRCWSDSRQSKGRRSLRSIRPSMCSHPSLRGKTVDNDYHPEKPSQATPLKPKKVTLYREVWRRIRDNGFDVIPLRGREGPFTGWPSQSNDDASIMKWSGRAAGIRFFGHRVFAIDLDVRTYRVREAIVDALTARWPDFMRGCLQRTSGSTTLALIGRALTVRQRAWTARYFAGEGVKPHMVEYFTGRDKRYLGVHGVHSHGREYGYIGRSILDTRIDELPWFPDADILELIELCESTMEGLGLRQVEVRIDNRYGEKVYDLEADMVFQLSSGERVKLEDLEKMIGDGRHMKGYATIWDPKSQTPDRVLVNKGVAGLALWDTKTGISHRWKWLAESDDKDFQRRLQELMSNHKFKWERGNEQ